MRNTMLKYCIMSKYGNCSKEEAIEFVEKTNKPFVYTYGLEYRNPTTHRKQIPKEKALEYAKQPMTDITEEENCVHINQYGEMDMW